MSKTSLPQSELHQKVWAVITDCEVIATDLTYEEAKSKKLIHTALTDNGGTCVVTSKTAQRMIKHQMTAKI